MMMLDHLKKQALNFASTAAKLEQLTPPKPLARLRSNESATNLTPIGLLATPGFHNLNLVDRYILIHLDDNVDAC